MKMSTFGQKARKLRERSGLTTRILAEKIGISHSQITRYETDQSEPTYSVLVNYKKVFSVSLDYLCDDNEE